MQETKSNNSSRKEFAVGDTVYCAIRGEGKVSKLFGGSNYPVLVRFNDYTEGCYTKDGKIHSQLVRTLFFSPPSIVAGDTEKPFKSELIGKEVLITFKGQFILNGKVTTEDENYIYLENDNQRLAYQKSSIKSIKLLGEEINF